MERRVNDTIELLQLLCGNSGCVVSDSGGKDSSVLKHIAIIERKRRGLKVSDTWGTGKKVFKWRMEDDNCEGQLAMDEWGNIFEEYT